MRTEYGFRSAADGDEWPEKWTREMVESWCRSTGDTMIAREVSDTRIVSVR